MKKTHISLILICFVSTSGFSQDVLTAFMDEQSDYKGFKNSDGETVLPARYGIFTLADEFKDIIAVDEWTSDSTVDSYYMLRNGYKFGRDSMYIFDFSFPLESEGFIIFQDPESELVGLFNKKGKVQIPALYNELADVRNGLLIALTDSKKEHMFEDEHAECNHWCWIGGKELLIDTLNNVLVDDFRSEPGFDFYSLLITSEPVNEPDRVNPHYSSGGF